MLSTFWHLSRRFTGGSTESRWSARVLETLRWVEEEGGGVEGEGEKGDGEGESGEGGGPVCTHEINFHEINSLSCMPKVDRY